MAYNKINYYKRVIKIQNIAKEKQALGIPNTRIYKDYIHERFDIAESTFKVYLGVPASRELKKLLKKKEEEKQMDLFANTQEEEKDEEIQ